MANKKVNRSSIEEILVRYDNGETPADLATSFGVHPTTVRRYLRQSGRELSRITHTTEIDNEVKLELRKILSKFKIDNIDIVISELDKYFNIEKKEDKIDEAFNIIHVK